MSKAEELASELERISPKQHTTYALAAALLRKQEAVIKQCLVALGATRTFSLVLSVRGENTKETTPKHIKAAIVAAKEALK